MVIQEIADNRKQCLENTKRDGNQTTVEEIVLWYEECINFLGML